MAEIKVGQKYRRAGNWGGALSEGIATVVSISDSRVNYKYESGREDFSSLGCFTAEEEILADRKFGYFVLVEDVEVEEDNQLSPNAYQFPNGVEVRHISAHLTSFGGQAVQYIARATRLDGVVKGLPVQDLKKAIQLLEWEVDRLEAGK